MEELRYSRVERRGGITVVTIARPEVLNALHAEANDELTRIFDAFGADPDQWVAILTGEGERAFSAGNDLKATAAGGDMGRGPEKGMAGITARFDLDKPLIAAVNGLAMGGGFEMVLACDIVLAAKHAVFSLPEPRVGLAALGGGLLRLPRAVGMTRALEMILTARKVEADEARTIGLVNEVVAAEDLLDRAIAIAETICQLGPLSVRASKQAALRSFDKPIEQATADQWDYPSMRKLLASSDFREGPRAFAEKRAPEWQGR